MPHDAFISYSDGDEGLADAVCHALEGHGVRCWVAPRDVPAGASRPEAVNRAIADSRAMVLVSSANAGWPGQAQQQVLLAAQQGVAILPVRIEGVATGGSMQAFLSSRPVGDRQMPRGDGSLNRFAEHVAGLVCSPSAGTTADSALCIRPAAQSRWVVPPEERCPAGGCSDRARGCAAPGMARGGAGAPGSRHSSRWHAAALGVLVLAGGLAVPLFPKARDGGPPAVMTLAASARGPKASAPQPRVRVHRRPPHGTSTWTNPRDGMQFVFVPAGVAVMGCDCGHAGEKPKHTVSLPGYWIGKREVTLGQFDKFVAVTGHRPAGDIKANGANSRLPVVNVSWGDATAYCKWAGVRLPTEAEWEKASRGAHGREYPWGGEWDPTRCNTAEGGPGMPAHVGSYPRGASPYGCLDMAGNVWEWCSSAYKPYPYQSDDGREEPGGSAERVNRGGAFNILDGPYFSRGALRSSDPPEQSVADLGFRCAASLE